MSLLGSKSAKKKDASCRGCRAKAAGCQAAARPPSQPAAAARGVVVEKPKANIYTALLALSFVAIVVGCICLYAEMSAYDIQLQSPL